MSYYGKGPREFIAAVLWIHGRSIGEIAKVVQWTPGQMRGFVNREFRDTPRANMDDETRRDLLAMMKASREDGDRLKDEHFLPIPLPGVPAPPTSALKALKRSWVDCRVIAEAIEDGDRRDRDVTQCNVEHRARLGKLPEYEGGLDLSTKVGRRDARQFETEVNKMVKAEQKKQADREAGLNPRRGKVGETSHGVIRSSALDYLFSARILRDPGGESDKLKSSEEQRRLEAGMRLRKHMEGTRLGGLGAIDYERATMGSGGGGKLSLSAYKLQCIHSLGGIKKLMSPMDFAMIEAVVDQDIFIWEKAKPESRTRRNIYEGIRHLLDIIAVHENLMTREACEARWDEPLPIIERVGRGEAISQAEAAAEFMEAAR